jgi:hypothetical protein
MHHTLAVLIAIFFCCMVHADFISISRGRVDKINIDYGKQVLLNTYDYHWAPHVIKF